MSEQALRRPLTSRFDAAFAYASELHRQQARKGTEIPYLSHLMSVASLALEHGANEDEAIAALLHDAVEDQGGDPIEAQIRARFGDAVADIVKGCTDSTVIPKPPWAERKARYVEHIATASASVRLVSASDKLHNATCLLKAYRLHGNETWARFNATEAQSLWYYNALVRAYRAAGGGPLVEELARVVEELTRRTGLADPLRCARCGEPATAAGAPYCSEACRVPGEPRT